ncbi:MAG: alpha/beta hydrolase [Burkholderiales bacterium]|nr:alpha/beta hydrolase [Burkholderiales bacterium]
MLLLSLAGLAGPASGVPQGLEKCRLRGLETPAWCGTLSRPLATEAPHGATITLHFAVLPALSRQRKPDPVFFFAGGPGQSAIDLAGPVAQLLGRFANRRDLVLIDQRGTGRSAPLVCDGDDTPTQPLRSTLDEALVLRDLARCREQLQALPYGDLRRYTTVEAVQDAEAVRQALGAERVNLVGVSYGTRVALDYLRQAPQAVRRVVLDGVAPPDMALPTSFAHDAQAAFDALLAWCEGDPACRQRHPRLRAQWQALLAALPREATLQHPVSGREERLTLTPDMLAGLARAPLYSPPLGSALPLAIEEAAAGRWAPLLGLASALGGGAPARLAQGEHFAVICSEDMPRAEALPPPQGAFSSLAQRYRRACADWPRAQLPPAFYRIGPAPAPVLLLSGALDPVTPPQHAERVAARLGARARHVVAAAAGHGQLALPCVREMVYRFVDAEDEAAALSLDAGCVQQLQRRARPPVFVPPGTAGGID